MSAKLLTRLCQVMSAPKKKTILPMYHLWNKRGITWTQDWCLRVKSPVNNEQRPSSCRRAEFQLKPADGQGSTGRSAEGTRGALLLFLLIGGIVLPLTKKSIFHLHLSAQGPRHLRRTPWLWLWFAPGSVAVTWSFMVPREKKIKINRGALE